MIDLIYIEESVANHSRVQRICARFPRATVVACERYGEVFNRAGQNFRLQKKRPALILARKHDGFVLPTPDMVRAGQGNTYYFSHMLNCPYDCRYCFLQGMYRSAHHVLFVNYEDFQAALDKKIQEHQGQTSFFFSGYDCDSLALESVTGFAQEFLPFFAERPDAYLELRTKSAETRCLLEREAMPNCVVAYSLSPHDVAEAVEHKTPPLRRRLAAIKTLAERGWPIGLRFDPLIDHKNFEAGFKELLQQVFEHVLAEQLHSVTLGPLRFPIDQHKTISRLFPEEPLFAAGMVKRDDMVSYPAEREAQMETFCRQALLEYIPENLLNAFVVETV